MADIEPIRTIRTDADYETALARIDRLMGAEPGSPEGRELDALVDLVDLFERSHQPMGYPDPVAAIEFRMEQAGLEPRDLIPFIGSRAKVSEVLSGKRPITMRVARALHEHLAIPVDVLRPLEDRPDQPPANLVQCPPAERGTS
jgi:HTH-type transcriptional regulator/antitoxin HigA